LIFHGGKHSLRLPSSKKRAASEQRRAPAKQNRE
jgi:hypothetical protein